MVLTFLDTKMEVPLPYSPFHIFFVLASIIAGFAISHRVDRDAAFIRRFLLHTSLLIIVLEIYKSLVQPLVPYPASILIYVAGFTTAAGIIPMLAGLLHISAPKSHRPLGASKLRLVHTGHS